MDNAEGDSSILNEPTENIEKALQSISESGTACDLLFGVIKKTTKEEVNKESFDPSTEASSISSLKELTDTTDYSSVNTQEMAEALSSSYLVSTYATLNPHSLSSIDTIVKTEIENLLEEKKNNGEITQERYNSLLLMFE